MSNLKPYSDFPNQIRALLSVKPKYADAILSGEKKYEFRRTIFSRHVDIVLIYVTAPVRRVIAEFDVLSVASESLKTLWKKTQKHAGIDEDSFFSYFEGLQTGYAIRIGEVRQYIEPFCPIRRLGVRPPQSFIYLENSEEKDWLNLVGKTFPTLIRPKPVNR